VERAERIIRAMGGHFSYSCMHVRRNDFQYTQVWLPADRILNNTRRIFRKNERLCARRSSPPPRRAPWC
jgi:hypothetical protein